MRHFDALGRTSRRCEWCSEDYVTAAPELDRFCSDTCEHEQSTFDAFPPEIELPDADTYEEDLDDYHDAIDLVDLPHEAAR